MDETFAEVLKWIAVAAGGGGIWKGADYILKYFSDRHNRKLQEEDKKHENKKEDRAEDRIDRKEAIDYLTAIADDLRKDVDRANANAARCLENEARCERRVTRLKEYVEYVAYEANKKGWDLRPWKDDGTDVHTPLPPAPDRRTADNPDFRGPDRRKPKRGDR